MILITHYLFGLLLFSVTFILGHLCLLKVNSHNLKSIVFFPIISIFSASTIIFLYFFSNLIVPLSVFIFIFIFYNQRKLLVIIKNFFFNYKFLFINLILLTYCLNNAIIVHPPSINYDGWALTDTMYGISRVYSYPTSFFEFKDLSLLNHSHPIAQSFFGILSIPFNKLNIFDPFYYISITIQVFSLLYLFYFLNLQSHVKKNNYELLLFSIFLICSLKYPFYFLENGWKAILIVPLAYAFSKLLTNIKKIKDLDLILILCILVLSIYLIKTGIIAILALLILVSYFNFSNRIKILIIFLVLLFALILVQSYSISNLINYFYEPHNILQISQRKVGQLNLAIILLSLLFFTYFLKMPNKIFVFLYSNLIIYFFFPSISVFNLFFTYLVLFFIFLEGNLIEFENKKINKKIYYIFILLFFIFNLAGYFLQNIYFAINILFVAFVYITLSYKKLVRKKIIFNIVVLICLIFSLNSYLQTYNLKKMVYEMKGLTHKHLDLIDFIKKNLHKDDLIFTDLGDIYNPYHGEYGDAFTLLLTKSNRQFYLLSFYTDLYNYYDQVNRLETIEINKKILKGSLNPKNLDLNNKYKNFLALTHSDSLMPPNFERIFNNEKFSIYYIK